MRGLKAVLLAGGKNHYLSPIIETRPVALLRVLNKPIIERILTGLPREIDEIFVTYDGNKQLKRFFQKRKKQFPNVRLVEEDMPLGPAGSLKGLEEVLKETFLVLQTDIISSVDVSKLIEFHKEKGGIVSLSVFRTPNPVDYGIVGLDDDNRILKFLEKPKGDQVFSTLVNAGTYVCEPSVLSEIPSHGYCDFAEDIFPRLLRRGELLYGFEFGGFWTDVGDFDTYLLSNRRMLERSMTLRMKSKQPRARIMPPVLVGRECRIGESTIGPVVSVGDGTRIGKKCKIYDSIIYENVRIGNNVLISSSIIGNDVEIGSGAVIIGSMIGDKAKIDARIKIGYDSRIWPKKKVRKDVGEGKLFGCPRDFRL